MNGQLIIIIEENTSSSYPKYIQLPMDLNCGVTLQLRFGTLYRIIRFRAANKIGTFKNLMSKLDFSNFTF